MDKANDSKLEAPDAPSGTAKSPHLCAAGVPARDTEAVERAVAGDPQALEELLAAARPRLLATALRMVRDRDDAEDVVQEAMLKVCRNVGRFEGRAALSTWLHRIVVNCALDRMRRDAVRPGHGCLAGERVGGGGGGRGGEGAERPAIEPVDDQTPEVLLGRAQVGAVVRGAMATLSSSHHEVLALRELEGESYRDIARSARCPVGTVMSRLHHARRRFIDELTENHFELLAA
jgi:RNA polymerase sigma-70 factor, ECF subfamily